MGDFNGAGIYVITHNEKFWSSKKGWTRHADTATEFVGRYEAIREIGNKGLRGEVEFQQRLAK